MAELFGVPIGAGVSDGATAECAGGPASTLTSVGFAGIDSTGIMLLGSFPTRTSAILPTESPAPSQPLSLAAQREAFIEKYKISKLGSSQVVLTLPEGVTRIEFLKEAQALSVALHASEPGKYRADRAVRPNRLESWKSERAFTDATEKALDLRINGNVKGSTNLTRREQKENGWNNVALQDLAVAHTAFYLLTGKDLFNRNIVRASGGALHFIGIGLDASHYNDSYRDRNVSASRSLPALN